MIEIKKEQTKVTAKRKPKPEGEPTKVDLQAKPDQISESAIRKPNHEETKAKDKNEEPEKKSESLKSKREKMFKQEKERMQKLKINEATAQQNRRAFQIALAITLLLLLIFAPIYPAQKVSFNNMNYLEKSDLEIANPLGNYFSPYQYFRYKSELAQSNEFIKNSKVTYDIKNMTVKVKVTEYKPLAKDAENNVYFYDDNEVIKKNNIELYAPIVSGFDQKKLETLLENMDGLDYDVIMQIDTIEYVGTEEDPELLKFGMDGDNTIYIDANQIEDKMPYYNQMRQIIDEKADGEPGIIHLDLGDYYEPKE